MNILLFYRKKPVVIRAIQWNGLASGLDNICEVFPNIKVIRDELDGFGALHFDVITLEGKHIASPMDYIIEGVKGEYYPCKPDIFEMTYEVCQQNIPE